jgi:hypothetical protein
MQPELYIHPAVLKAQPEPVAQTTGEQTAVVAQSVGALTSVVAHKLLLIVTVFPDR